MGSIPDGLADAPPLQTSSAAAAASATAPATAPASSAPPTRPHPAASAAKIANDDSYAALGSSDKDSGADLAVTKPRKFSFTDLFRKRTLSKEEKLKKEQEKQERERLKK